MAPDIATPPPTGDNAPARRKLPHLLYSACAWVKWHIQKHYFDDVHFCWCSPVFDPQRLGPEDHGSLVPASSSPADIYRDLSDATASKTGRVDKHNAKIAEGRGKLIGRVEGWRAERKLHTEDCDNILYMLNDDQIVIWKPLLFVIPTSAIDPARIQLVPMKDRAGYGEEYVIRDLRGSEFDRIEFGHG